MGKTEKIETEVSAKTIDEAIMAGCAELGVGMDEVDFEIIDQGGIFRKMKVRIVIKKNDEQQSEPAPQKEIGGKKPKTPKKVQKNASADRTRQDGADRPDPTAAHEIVDGETSEFIIEGKERQARQAREQRPVTEFDPNAPKFVKSLEFAEKLFKLLDETLTVTTSYSDREFVIEVHGENVSRLIGKEGRTMSCINTIVSSVAINHANGEGRRVVVDIENYRAKRRQALADLAKRKAEWVIQSGRTIKLEPMAARERVIIHTALQDMEGIKTHSVGDEPNRCIVISPSAR
jgi:spoIIIJ-associated protein